jgi:hypothetical protein
MRTRNDLLILSVQIHVGVFVLVNAEGELTSIRLVFDVEGASQPDFWAVHLVPITAPGGPIIDQPARRLPG